MKRTLKAYQIKLETVGPVFVGNGKEIPKKEYLFLSKNEVGILDTVKLYQFMKKRNLQEAFEDYIVNNGKQDLGQWLSKYRIEIEEMRPCMKYVLDSGDTVLQRGTKTSVMEHIKDAYGFSYIPGSTIKGMLRTILLAEEVGSHSLDYEPYKQNVEKTLRYTDRKSNRTTYLQKEIKQIETEAFHLLEREHTKPTDAVNDILSGMIVGDSQPIGMEQMILCQRIKRHIDGWEKPLNLLQCIKPGTTIEFMLTIDESLCKVTIKDICRALKQFNLVYNESFLSAYKGFDLLRENHCFVGGGIGFVSKTIVYPMFGKQKGIKATQMIFEHTKVPQNHKHNRDAQLGVSPYILKCSKYKGKILQMGLCKIISIKQLALAGK